MCQALIDLRSAVYKIDKNSCLMKSSKIYPGKKKERTKKLHLIVYVLLGLILPSIPHFNCVNYTQYNNKVETYVLGS